MARIDVKLIASLRNYVPGHGDGLVSLNVRDGTRASEVPEAIGFPADRVKMVMVNGRRSSLDACLRDGDRVSLFPPEAAFNMYVALYFREDLVGDQALSKKK